MPPDVFLALLSSGVLFVAALLYFTSDDPPRPEPTTPIVSYCLPPARRQRVVPPPLPSPPQCAVDVSTALTHGVMTLRPAGEEWEVTLDLSPVGDAPAARVGGAGPGAVHDLRVHGRAGTLRPTSRSWKQKPGRA